MRTRVRNLSGLHPLQTHFRFCLCDGFRQGYLLVYGVFGTAALRFPAVRGDSPAVDSGGSFQLWLLWLLELPCSRRGHLHSASLTWDLKASASLWLLRCRG